MKVLTKRLVTGTAATSNNDGMFMGAAAFNQTPWLEKCFQRTNMEMMFCEATSFNGDIFTWNIEKVTKLNGLFDRAISFNGDIFKVEYKKCTRHERIISRGFSLFNCAMSNFGTPATSQCWKHVFHVYAGF